MEPHLLMNGNGTSPSYRNLAVAFLTNQSKTILYTDRREAEQPLSLSIHPSRSLSLLKSESPSTRVVHESAPSSRTL